MTDLKNRLSDLELSSVDLSEMSDFDPRFIEDYLSMKDDIQTIANHVEPPPGTPGILRDDLDGKDDLATAPTSNQAYILDQKTIDNKEIIDDHVGDAENPHETTMLNLADVLTESYTGLKGAVPVVSTDITNNTLAIIIRALLAIEIGFDDTEIGSNLDNLQELIEFFDDQIALRETAATGIVSGGLVTQTGPSTVSVDAGEGEIVDGYTDRKNPSRSVISWDAVPSLSVTVPPTGLGIRVIYVDGAEVVQEKSNPLTASERRTLVQIAFAYYEDGAIITIVHAGVSSNEVGNTLYDWMFYTDFSSRVRGMGIRPVSAALSVFADEGTFIAPGINVHNSLTDPNVGIFPAVGDINTPLTFDVIFQDGTDYITNQTVIPKFYESAPGVATALQGNDATIGYLHRTFANGFVFQLGANTYTNGAVARDSLNIDLDGHTFFIGSEVTLPSSQIYNDRTSSDFSDTTKAGLVSLIGAGAGASGSVAVTRWVDLSDTLPTTFVGNALKYSRVLSNEAGLDLVDLTIIDDSTPQLGGELQTQSNDIIIQSDAVTEEGRIGDTASGGVFFARTENGVYNPNDGGVAAEAGILEIHGGIAQVKTLAGISNREVWANADGSLFSVEPPPPGFTVSDSDNGSYGLPTLGTFVLISGLQVVIPQAVAVGEPLQVIVNLHIINGSSTRGGTIDIATGINGAAPTGNGINKVISGGLDAVIPVSITTTGHGGLAINDTMEVWARKATEEHNQFNPRADATAGGLHEMAASNEASSGGISLATAEALHRIQTRTVSGSTSLLLTDERNKIDYNSASAGNITINPVGTTAYPVGFQCLVKQLGAGQFTLVAGAGVTIDAEDSFLISAKQNTVVSLIYDGVDSWTASGNLV